MRFRLIMFTLPPLAFLTIYSFYIEPIRLEVTRHEIFGEVASPIKIAHLTDLHLRKIGHLEKALLDALENEKPDLIIITGDTVSEEETSYAVARDFLSRLHAPLGVVSVEGNWEHWTSEEHSKQTLAAIDNVVFLTNGSKQIRQDAWIVGLDDAFAGKPNPGLAFAGIPPDSFCIMLFHSPAYFPEVADKCPLALSGHTHGGQIRLPFFGPLWLPPGSGEYVSGWYEKVGARMYVSRGLGTSLINARFLSRPEIALITVRNSK